jgi:hypothetical protein
MIVALSVIGCSDATLEDGKLDAWDGEPVTAALPGDELPPPPTATLTLNNPSLVLGKFNNLTVTGLGAGQIVRIYRTTGTGSTPTCLASPVICLDLNGPTNRIVVAGSGTADGTGKAVISVWVPTASTSYTNRYQAVGDYNNPTGYTVSNVTVGAYVAATGDTDSDGLTNTQELTYSTDPGRADTDGGGLNDGAEVSAGKNPLNAADDGADSDSDGYTSGADCNDSDPAVNPGAKELCNAVDDDCDGSTNESDFWWDPAWPYRALVTVTGPATLSTVGLPVALDVDFAALLAAVGNTSGLAANSIRVVRQDCALGAPEMPSEWMDDVSGIWARQDIVDPTGDEFGAVAFQIDADGDYTTDEALAAGSSVTFGIYFGATDNAGSVPAPGYTSGLVATSSASGAELSNSLLYSTYAKTSASGAVGGLTDTLGPQGGANVGRQASYSAANGIFFNANGGGPNGRWLSAKDDTNATIEVIHEGPIFSAVRSSGTRSITTPVTGGFDYEYTYMLFAESAELYVKPYFAANTAAFVGPQGSFWNAAVRVFGVDNNSALTLGTSDGTRSSPGFEWVRGGYGNNTASPVGFALGYRNSVTYRAAPVFSTNGRYVGLTGEDLAAATTSQRAVSPGDVLVNYPVLAAYPHTGLFSTVQADFYGSLVGASTTLGAAQSY